MLELHLNDGVLDWLELDELCLHLFFLLLQSLLLSLLEYLVGLSGVFGHLDNDFFFGIFLLGNPL